MPARVTQEVTAMRTQKRCLRRASLLNLAAIAYLEVTMQKSTELSSQLALIVDITLRVMPHAEREAYDQLAAPSQGPRRAGYGYFFSSVGGATAGGPGSRQTKRRTNSVRTSAVVSVLFLGSAPPPIGILPPPMSGRGGAPPCEPPGAGMPSPPPPCTPPPSTRTALAVSPIGVQ